MWGRHSLSEGHGFPRPLRIPKASTSLYCPIAKHNQKGRIRLGGGRIMVEVGGGMVI